MVNRKNVEEEEIQPGQTTRVTRRVTGGPLKELPDFLVGLPGGATMYTPR